MSRTGKIVRFSLVLALLALTVAAFVRPGAVDAGQKATGRTLEITPHGLILTDAEGLVAHIRRPRPAKGVLVSAWATWCEACKGDFPVLVAASREFAGQIDVLFVSMDELDNEENAVNMLSSFGAPGPAFIVDKDIEAFKAKLHPRWPGMLPASFLFDASGKLRYFWGGPVEDGELAPLLRRFLAGEQIDGEANFALAPGAVKN